MHLYMVHSYLKYRHTRILQTLLYAHQLRSEFVFVSQMRRDINVSSVSPPARLYLFGCRPPQRSHHQEKNQ